MTPIKDEFTLETFRKALEALAVDRPSQRQLVVYTGVEGMRNIHDAFETANALEQVIFLKEKKTITEEEAQRLEDMIISKDRENFELAKYIIAQKSLPFLQTKSIEKCLYNSKPTITVTQAPTL